VVLTREEIRLVLRYLDGVYWLVGCLLYGSGLRRMEGLRLRVKDVDFVHRALLVREGKGGKDRVLTLADELSVPLKQRLEAAKLLHRKDLADGFGAVYLPHALDRRNPNAPREWGWQRA
jgi:integrase